MKTYVFIWKNKNGLIVQFATSDNSFQEALEKAKKWGYIPRKWYKPSTWGNHFSID